MEGEGKPQFARSQVTARTVWTVALNLLAFWVALTLLRQVSTIVGWVLVALTLLRQVSTIVGWVLVALLLALALDPAVRLVERRLSRTWAVVVVMGGALALVGVLIATLVPMLIDQGRALVKATPGLLDSLRSGEFVRWADDKFDVIARAKRELAGRAGAAAGPLFQLVGSILHSVAATVTITVLTAFMLLFGGEVFRTGLCWFRPDDRERYVSVAARIRRSVGHYVLGTLLIASIGGVVTAVTLLLLGVPYFLPLGLAMMFLGILPFIGALLGGLLMVGMAFTAGTQAGIIAAVVFVVYQQAENHLLQPLVQRRTIRMNPLLIALALLVGTAAHGVLGALLALPMAAALQIVLGDMLDRRRRRWGEAPPPPRPEPPRRAPVPQPA